MKVSFYLDNDSSSDIDLSIPKNGNPGIGGTQFMIWSVSYYLNNLPDIEVTLFAHNIDFLPENICKIKVDSIEKAALESKKNNSDIFVFRAVTSKAFFQLIDKIELKSVAWGHNFGDGEQLKYIAETKFVRRYICVGKEQYDALRDHKVFNKAAYIYNGLDFSIYNKINIDPKKERIVCYIGSLIPPKGFHILAKIWPDIEKQVPGVKLYVIGSGQLYDRNAKLGKYRIADQSYENKFMKFLVDDNGKIKKNIHFFGIQGGQKKLELMSNAKVGVVNPTGRTETFGIGAVEFQALKVPVVTIAKFGFFDTVRDKKSGVLARNRKMLKNSIINLLMDEIDCDKMGEAGSQFVQEKFNINQICFQWRIIFEEIIDNIEAKQHLITNNYKNNLKWLRELNRKLKTIPMLKGMPSIIDYISYVKSIVIKIKRMI